MNPLGRASVLDCGDGVFGVAVLGRGGRVGGVLRSLERRPSQSGDFADSVTALQNLAARRRFTASSDARCGTPWGHEPDGSAGLRPGADVVGCSAPGRRPALPFMVRIPPTECSRFEPVNQQARASVLECASPLALSSRPDSPSQSARGLAHSKTWRSFGGSWGG